MTLIEVLVTALMVGLIASATSIALISAAHASGDQRLRSEADAVAAQDQERLRGLSDEQLANLGSAGSTRTVQVNGTSFQVTSNAAFQDAQGNSSCTSSAVDYYKITSTVSWSEAFHAASAQTQSLTAESLLSRPVTGNLATSVTDQTGAFVPGATVTATPTPAIAGQSAETAVSDASGCAMLTGLQAGTYGLSIFKSGYVDWHDASPTTWQPNVTVGTTGTASTASDVIGLAGSITASFTTYNGAPGEANAISYLGAGNTLQSPAWMTASSTPSTSAATTVTASKLFPFNGNYGPNQTPSYTNNWTVYPGSCSFQKPGGTSSTGGTVTTYTVGPGQAATTPTGPSGATAVQEPFLKLSSIKGQIGGSRTTQSVQPTDIVLTYSGGSPTCTDRYEASIANPQSGTGVGATPPANGWLANPGQPYAPAGDLSVCADYGYVSNGVTTWYSGTASAANTSTTSANAVPAITLSASSRCPGAS